MKRLRWSALPQLALMPRWLAALRADGERAEFRLRLSWSGRYSLAPAKIPAGEPCILVFDGALPYRRRLQRLPATRKARLALLGTAPEEFPLPADDLHYGLGLRGEDAYLYALPRQALAQAAAGGLRPTIALVAGEGAADPAAVLAAFEAYLREGPALDLLRAGRFLSRGALLRAELAGALACALAASAALLLVPSLTSGVLELRAEALREQGGALPKLYRVTEVMADAQAEAAKLYAGPEARLPGILGGLFESVPPGRSLRSVEFKDGTLRITGSGAGVKDWLVAQGFPPERIEERQAGALQSFSAERPL